MLARSTCPLSCVDSDVLHSDAAYFFKGFKCLQELDNDVTKSMLSHLWRIWRRYVPHNEAWLLRNLPPPHVPKQGLRTARATNNEAWLLHNLPPSLPVTRP